MNNTISNVMMYADNLFDQLFAKLIIAVIILLIGFIIGRIVGKVIYRVLHELQIDRNLNRGGINFALEKTVSHVITYFIYFISIIWALNELGLTTTVLNMISAAALILIILSILLAIKDFIPNFIAGFMIFQKKLYKEGDNVEVEQVKGKINSINMIETEFLTEKGDIIHIPNSTIIKNKVIVKKDKKL